MSICIHVCRLFYLTGDDLLQIGMLSVGHRKELLVGVASSNYHRDNTQASNNTTYIATCIYIKIYYIEYDKLV